MSTLSTVRSICGCTVSTICFSVLATEATIIAASGRGRSARPDSPVLQADITRVSPRLLSATTSFGPWRSSCAAGPSRRIGTSTEGPNSDFDSVWAREDSLPGTTLIEGDRASLTPSPSSEKTTAKMAQKVRAARGRLIESLARRIMVGLL